VSLHPSDVYDLYALQTLLPAAPECVRHTNFVYGYYRDILVSQVTLQYDNCREDPVWGAAGLPSILQGMLTWSDHFNFIDRANQLYHYNGRVPSLGYPWLEEVLDRIFLAPDPGSYWNNLSRGARDLIWPHRRTLTSPAITNLDRLNLLLARSAAVTHLHYDRQKGKIVGIHGWRRIEPTTYKIGDAIPLHFEVTQMRDELVALYERPLEPISDNPRVVRGLARDCDPIGLVRKMRSLRPYTPTKTGAASRTRCTVGTICGI
jgi:hypothetical protein